MPFPEPESDFEFERLLSDASELGAQLGSSAAQADSEAFLAQVARLQQRFAELRPSREELDLQLRCQAYADHRLGLVDEAHEYAQATQELLALSLVLSAAPDVVAPALQHGVLRLSAVLSEPGVPRLFGRLLRRLRELARVSGSAELRAWVDGVVSALPD
jgi:hypothetical protein